MKRVKKIIGFILLVILIFIIMTLFVPLTFTSTKSNDKYDKVLSESITNMNAKIVDIALLGSHDSFSDGITFSSNPNTNEGGNEKWA